MHTFCHMASKTYYESDLNEAWHHGWLKAIELSKARNHAKNNVGNTRRYALGFAIEMMDLGCMSPEAMDTAMFLQWKERVVEGRTRTGRPLGNASIKKRMEKAKLLFLGCKLPDQVEILDMHKVTPTKPELVFWTREELQAMTHNALRRFDADPESGQPSVAHILNVICPSRRSDTAAMRWLSIDFRAATIQFPAAKNGKRPGNIIDKEYIPLLKRWKVITAAYAGGDEYVFPRSMAHPSGSTKTDQPHVTGATIAKWLKQICETTVLGDEHGSVQNHSSHKYRHTFAMHALEDGKTLQYIAKVLGDSPATVEQYYCEFRLDAEHRRQHNKGKHRRKQRIPATHTAQPAGLMRPLHPGLTGRQHDMVQSMRALGIGTEEFDPVGDGPYGEGDGDQDGGVDAGGFEPPAFWLQTRRSSN
jgi:integrase